MIESRKLERKIKLNNEDMIEEAKRKALIYVRSKSVSNEAVFFAMHDLIESDFPREVVRIIQGFDGGIGFYNHNACGALCGGIAAIGLIYGNEIKQTFTWKNTMKELLDEEIPIEKKVKLILEGFKGISIYNQLVNRFKKRFGSIYCSELTRPWKKNHFSIERLKNCQNIISESAGLTMELILQAERSGFEFEWGENFSTGLTNF